MVEFAFGFACGVLTIAIVWVINLKQKNTIIIQNMDTGEAKVYETDTVVKKPDNALVRKVTTEEYKAERAYIEEMNKKRAASLSRANRS